jgi:hypothetical protein
LEQLVLVDNEILVEHWDVHTTTTGCADKVIAAAKVLLIGQDAQCSSTVLLVAQGDDVGLALLFNPAL